MSGLLSAWNINTQDPIIKKYLIQEELQLPDGQEFVWQLMVNLHTDNPDRFHWSRRHIRAIGHNRTFCYGPCGSKLYNHDWSLEPNTKGVVDECPECRGMSNYYSKHNAPGMAE